MIFFDSESEPPTSGSRPSRAPRGPPACARPFAMESAAPLCARGEAPLFGGADPRLLRLRFWRAPPPVVHSTGDGATVAFTVALTDERTATTRASTAPTSSALSSRLTMPSCTPTSSTPAPQSVPWPRATPRTGPSCGGSAPRRRPNSCDDFTSVRPSDRAAVGPNPPAGAARARRGRRPPLRPRARAGAPGARARECFVTAFCTLSNGRELVA
ncbi:hypothetical protein M885DRAFT_107558 [Pelagophyceae sp. CCMP2097]|nr:hypothetical protein M885DRAFT_107558 [Pelagophyceae sp. CCMP2097]